MKHLRLLSWLGFLLILASSCTSTPKASQSIVTEKQAKIWFENYCSKGAHLLTGDLVLKANTKEFKGQFPASLRFEVSGGFVLEVTSLIGGTMLRLTSDGKEMDMLVPSKPRYNRNHITHYLGLDLSILSQLLEGDLPCPAVWKSGAVRASGNQMQIITDQWKWSFEKADEKDGSIPVRVVLEPRGAVDSKLNIELNIDNWDQDAHYAKKVIVKSPEGELKWTWRNRN